MAFPNKTVQVLAPQRSFLLLIVTLFVLTWSANSEVDEVASCRKDSDGDCSSSTTADEPSEVHPETMATFSLPQAIEKCEFLSGTKMENMATLTEKSSSRDSTSQPEKSSSRDSTSQPEKSSSSDSTSQPEKSANEPVLPTKQSSDTKTLSIETTSSLEETVTLTTEESSDTQPLKSRTTLNSELVTLSRVESTITSYRDSRPPTCCHSAQNFPFADILYDDPCKLMTGRKGVGKKVMADFEPELVKQVYDHLMGQLLLLKQSVDNTLNKDVLNVCREVGWPSLAEIPTRQELEPFSNGEILFLYYSSLLNHTAHLHHMVSQLDNYDRTCSRSSIYKSARELAFDIRKLTCFLRLFILAVYDEYDDQSFEKPAKEALEVLLCDERVCSRRALYDCQVVSSLNEVLVRLAAFIEKPDPIETMKKLKPDIQRRCRSVLGHPDL